MNLQPKFPSVVPSSKVYGILFGWFPVLLATLAGYWYALKMFSDVNKDTTRYSNTAAMTVGFLSVLCFVCARALGADEDKPRDRFAYAGERFFHATLLFLLASGLKYAVNPGEIVQWVKTAAGVLAAVFFIYAIMNARTGLQAAYTLLFERHTRHPDWDELI